MKGEKKSIPDLVRQFAKEWYEEFALPGQEGVRRRMPTLESTVYEYMTEIFPHLLDAVMGIRRDYRGVEILESKEGKGHSVAELLRLQARKQLLKQGEKLLAASHLKLNKRELTSLRAAYRRTLISQLESELEELAKKRAEEMAEHELDKLMTADEWVALIEHRVANNRKKKVDDA